MFDIWNEKQELAEAAYQQKNYKIKSVDSRGRGGYCVIYCSSNNIWYPNEEGAFRDAIIAKDRYEWDRIKCSHASREIYVRDIFKSWYVTGINAEINSIDKLGELLLTLARGLPIITVGSSSGGYLATILSYILDAEYAIVFSAQFELRNKWAYSVNPILQKNNDVEERSKYYDLRPWLEKSTVPVYYVVPYFFDQDRYSFNHINGVNCIHPIMFNSRHHGVVMPKCCLTEFISLPQEKLADISNRCIGKKLSPFGFSVRQVGVMKTVKGYMKQGFSKVKREIKRLRSRY